MRLRAAIAVGILVGLVLIAMSPPRADATELAGSGDCDGWTLDNSLWHVSMTVTASTDPAISGTVAGNSIRFFPSPYDGTNGTVTITVLFGDGGIDSETLIRDVTECPDTTTTTTTQPEATTTSTSSSTTSTTTTVTTAPPSTTSTTTPPITTTLPTSSTTTRPPPSTTVPPTTTTSPCPTICPPPPCDTCAADVITQEQSQSVTVNNYIEIPWQATASLVMLGVAGLLAAGAAVAAVRNRRTGV